MTWKQADYDEIRTALQPGDVIAFADIDDISSWIKAATRGPVSHVGVVLRSSADETSAADPSPQIMEARGELDERFGVNVRGRDSWMALPHNRGHVDQVHLSPVSRVR